MALEFKIFLIIISLFLIIFFSPTTIKAAIIGAPFVPAPKKVIRHGLKIAKLKSKERLYDLGSGMGRVLVIAAKEFNANVIGVEYSIPLFIFSKINLFIHQIKNGTIYRKDFFKEDIKLSEADVIFLFLTPKAFPKIKDKFEKELKPGARIVVYSSPLLFWKPVQTITIPGAEGKIYLYIKKT